MTNCYNSASNYSIEFIGDPCGRHGAYTFFRAFRFRDQSLATPFNHSTTPTPTPNAATWRRLQLGRFFHAQVDQYDDEMNKQQAIRARSCGTTQLRPFKSLPVKGSSRGRNKVSRKIPLIGELQLLWEDRNREGEKLASVRFYAAPDHCPEGRQPHHGENEILAQEEKLVLRLSQLVLMVVQGPDESNFDFSTVAVERPQISTSKVDLLNQYDVDIPKTLTFLDDTLKMPKAEVSKNSICLDVPNVQTDNIAQTLNNGSEVKISQTNDAFNIANPQADVNITKIVSLCEPNMDATVETFKKSVDDVSLTTPYADHAENKSKDAEKNLSVESNEIKLSIVESQMTQSLRNGYDGKSIHFDENSMELNTAKSPKCSLRVLSYPQYCRFRGALKRLENNMETTDTSQRVSATIPTKVYFCRETTSIYQLQNFEHRLNHLAPSLKGRKRKKKNLTNKQTESEDSNESEYHFESNKNKEASNAVSSEPDEKDVEIACKKLKLSSETEGDGRLAIGFMRRLHKFMNDLNQPIAKTPVIGFKEVDLYKFYMVTKNLGGYHQVTEKRLWKVVYDQLGGSAGNTSAATGTRKIYEKLLLPFEQSKLGDKITSKKISRIRPPKVESTIIKIELHDDQKLMTTSQSNSVIMKKDGVIMKKDGVIINKEGAGEYTAEKVDGQIKVEIAESSPAFECKVSIKKLDASIDTKRDNKVKNLQRKLERLERRVKKCTRLNVVLNEDSRKEDVFVDLTADEPKHVIKIENVSCVKEEVMEIQRQDGRGEAEAFSSVSSLTKLRPILPSTFPRRPSSANDVKQPAIAMRSVICTNASHIAHAQADEPSLRSQTAFSRSAIFAALSSSLSPRHPRSHSTAAFPAMRSNYNRQDMALMSGCNFSSPLKQFLDKARENSSSDSPMDLSMRTLRHLEQFGCGPDTTGSLSGLAHNPDQPLDLSMKLRPQQTQQQLTSEAIDLCVSNWNRGACVANSLRRLQNSSNVMGGSRSAQLENNNHSRFSLPLGISPFIHPSLIPNLTVLSQSMRPTPSPTLLLNPCSLPISIFQVLPISTSNTAVHRS